MPLVQTINKSKAIIGIWQISESENELLSAVISLSIKCNHLLTNIGSEKKRKERLCSLLLINSLTNNKNSYNFDINGKPILENSNKHISISNSNSKVAIMLSDVNCGIDLQYKQEEKLFIISKKFLSQKELSALNPIKKNNLALHLIWSAKEAIYKKVNRKGLSFKNEIECLTFDFINTKKLLFNYIDNSGSVQQQSLGYSMLDDFCLVYTSD